MPVVEMKTAFVILFCACAAAVNAQYINSEHVAALEESLDNIPDQGLGEASYSEVGNIGEGAGNTAGVENLARNYDEDSEVITGVTDSNIVNYGLSQQYVQAPADQYESQSAPSPSNIKCLEKNERYPVSGSCDRYIECLNGTAEEKLCPDGLRFNPNVRFNAYPCQYPSEMPCLGRSSLQPAQPTDDCPNQFGYFKIGDSQNCSSFRSCVNGVGYDFTCPEGLAFSSATYRCEWPDEVADCDAEAFLGFKCPEVPITKELGPPAGYRFYRSSTDCQRYFLCIEGKPRSLNCGGHSAFDELTSSCVAADEIEACPLELKSAAAESKAAEQRRQAAEELLNQKRLRGEPIVSTVSPTQSRYEYTTSPAKYERLISTVTPELYGDVASTAGGPIDAEENF